MMIEVPEYFVPIVYSIVCPVPNEQVPYLFQSFLYNISLPPNIYLPNGNEAICDDNFLGDLLESAQYFIETFYSLRTHRQFCKYDFFVG